MYKIAKVLFLAFAFVSTLYLQDSFAQSKKKKPKSEREVIRESVHSRDSLLQTLSKTDTSVSQLLQHISQYITNFNQINNNLAQGLDTIDASQQLPRIASRISRIQTLANTKKSSTLRYLFVLRDNLDHIQSKLEDFQSGLDDVSTRLIQNQHDLLRCSKDTLLNVVPQDSVLRITFYDRLGQLRTLYQKTDAINRANLLKVNLLQNKVSVQYAAVLDETDQIDARVTRFFNRAVDGEFGYIWQVDTAYNNLNSSIKGTVALNQIQLYYFMKNGSAIHLIALAFFLIILGWIFYNKAKSSRQLDNPEVLLDKPNYIYTTPIISALLVTTTISPYFYDHPPVSFLEIVFLISAILVLILIRRNFSGSLFNYLHLLFWLAFLYSISNLFVQITNFDRLATFVLSALSIFFTILFYKKIKQSPDGQLPRTSLVVKLFVVLQILSMVLNFFGNFSLAKIVGITAVFNLWMLVNLYFVVQIIIQGLFLQFRPNKEKDTFVNLIDYNTLQKKFQSVLNTFAALLWIFFLLQNLNIDDWVHDYLTDLLSQSRSIGGASFTFGGFVVFIIVIWLSTLMAKIISFFYDVATQHATDIDALKKKNRASTLLIRIGVFTIGFLLAVAASGFPIDKLTIIFSAFGVGIGFGLQNIVNNLVSGMILAFEKPIQIGDIIEVSNQAGTIKEIGIRSSRLATHEGAEVIIPNGDLISQHVINWTLSNNNRRAELIVGAAYGSDIQKIKNLLKDMLESRDDIMTKPAPAVFLHNLSESSVDFRIFFWAADISNFLELKSKVLADIYDRFNKEGIEIPFPQRDVNLHFKDENPFKSLNPGDKEGSRANINKTPPEEG
jgi:small-conductance mechanosensitive channel